MQGEGRSAENKEGGQRREQDREGVQARTKRIMGRGNKRSTEGGRETR